MADPTITNTQSQNSSGFFQSLYDGILKGDFSSNNSKTKTYSQIGVGLVPGIGQIADARDTFAAVKDVNQGKPSAWKNFGFSLLGWVPLVGDFAKSVNKIGLKNTYKSFGESISSIKQTWNYLSKKTDKQFGKFEGLFYKPSTNMDKIKLAQNADGITNRWGDIEIKKSLYNFRKILTFDHENVHRFFSPKFKFGRDFRAKVGLTGYIESHLLRRVEEGLAEAWAKYQLHGFKGIKKGWNFPIKYDYGINPDRLKVERNILLGIGSSALGTGAVIGDSINKNE